VSLFATASGVPDITGGVVAIGPDATSAILALLSAGCVVRLAWTALGLLRLRHVRAMSIPADDLTAISMPLERELGARADIRYSSAVDGPATIGMLRPVVLLPQRFRDLAPPIQRAVLCHELLHVRRRDWLPQLLEELWCGVFWFHPAARALANRLSISRETVVDAAAIAVTRDRRAYAAALLAFATAPSRLAGATPFIRPRHFERRIALIAREASMPRSSIALKLTLTAGAVILATAAATSHVPMTATLHAQPEKVYNPKEDKSLTLPRVIREVKPTYTPEAMKAKIQGVIWLSVVVLRSGDVGDVQVTKSLDQQHGLDAQAVAAARQWKFAPGEKDGKPVSVEVTVEMTFTLKK
jgi:TonB family protein